jgi:ABC-2 type transport system permease protein
VYSLRVFLFGGLTSFRALFAWLNPWIYIPSLLIAPIFQILLFTNLGRAANVESDRFFLIGNAIQYIAVPCLFAMGHAIAGERFTNTLGIVLTSPARRIPLFLGRSLPVLLNGCLVAMFSLTVGAALLGEHIPASAWPKIALVVLVAAGSCTGLGMIIAASALRVRETAVASNIMFGFLLVFCGVNVPLGALPGWMVGVSNLLPLTHAIEAARRLADGASLGGVAGLLVHEAIRGVIYFAIGLGALALLERQSRRTASLERS